MGPRRFCLENLCRTENMYVKDQNAYVLQSDLDLHKLQRQGLTVKSTLRVNLFGTYISLICNKYQNLLINYTYNYRIIY